MDGCPASPSLCVFHIQLGHAQGACHSFQVKQFRIEIKSDLFGVFFLYLFISCMSPACDEQVTI